MLCGDAVLAVFLAHLVAIARAAHGRGAWGRYRITVRRCVVCFVVGWDSLILVLGYLTEKNVSKRPITRSARDDWGGGT